MKRTCLLALLIFVEVMSSCGSVPARSSECAFAASASAASNGDSSAVNDSDDDGDNIGSTADIPLLPASDPNSDIPSIRLGETIQFEEMGPIIINLDGTTRRIDNWNEMTKQEQAVSWRRIAKRNEERRKILMEKMMQEQELGDDGKHDDES